MKFKTKHKYWTTKDKRILKFSDMSDEHMENAILMLKAKKKSIASMLSSLLNEQGYRKRFKR